MNPAVKELWLTALRSGKYTQGRRRLKRTYADGHKEHCCLGVLCEIASAVGIATERTEIDILDANSVVSFYQSGNVKSTIGMPSTKILNWAGLDAHDAMALADKNDSGRTFSEIAEDIASL